jgi:hypothetical protein
LETLEPLQEAMNLSLSTGVMHLGVVAQKANGPIDLLGQLRLAIVPILLHASPEARRFVPLV